MIWGLTLEGGQMMPLQNGNSEIRLSMAALKSAENTDCSNIRIAEVYIHTGDDAHLLCTLVHGAIYQQTLDLVLQPNDCTTFSLLGSGTVSLTGYSKATDRKEICHKASAEQESSFNVPNVSAEIERGLNYDNQSITQESQVTHTSCYDQYADTGMGRQRSFSESDINSCRTSERDFTLQNLKREPEEYDETFDQEIDSECFMSDLGVSRIKEEDDDWIEDENTVRMGIASAANLSFMTELSDLNNITNPLPLDADQINTNGESSQTNRSPIQNSERLSTDVQYTGACQSQGAADRYSIGYENQTESDFNRTEPSKQGGKDASNQDSYQEDTHHQGPLEEHTSTTGSLEMTQLKNAAASSIVSSRGHRSSRRMTFNRRSKISSAEISASVPGEDGSAVVTERSIERDKSDGHQLNQAKTVNSARRLPKRDKMQYHCTYCIKSFFSLMRMKRHKMAYHRKAAVHKCSICEKVYSKSVSLTNHFKMHTHQLFFRCQTCGAVFSCKDLWMTHKATHVKKRTYTCRHCTKAFDNITNMYQHEKSHNITSKQVKCKTCSKEFRFKSQLLYHERIHNGVKPFTCRFCPKTFAYKSVCAKHELIHTGEKPHKCKFCCERFRHSTSKKVHEDKYCAVNKKKGIKGKNITSTNFVEKGFKTD